MMIGQGWPQEKQYVDLKDRDGSWLVGVIIAKNESHIRVRCQGWSPRYDETFPASSDSILRHPKLQPFRTHTRGYTGQRKTVASRDHWKFSTDEHEGRMRQLQEFTAGAIELSPSELWQYIRGDHYFYVDFLMSSIYLSQDDLTKVYQYFKIHIRLCKLYLEKMLECGIREWLGKGPSMQNEHEETYRKAYSDCYFQIFDALYSIAGLNERLACFPKLNEKIIKQIVGIYETHQNYVSNELLVGGTFQEIKKAIFRAHAQLTCNNPSKIPFIFSYTIIQMFLIIQKTLQLEKDPDLNQLLDKLFIIVSKIMDEMRTEDLRGTTIDQQVAFLLTNIRSIYTRHNRKEMACDWAQQFRVKFYVLTIKSTSLDRKLRGITKMKEYCQDLIHFLPSKQPKMTLQKFHRLFKELKCQQVLFEQNEHSEIFKKAIQLICFLYRYGMVGIDSIVYIWKHSINKDAAVVKHLHNYWNELALRLQPDDNSKFIQVVSNYYSSDSPSKDTNEAVQFIFKFIQSIIKNYNYQKYRTDPPSNLAQIENNITILIEQLYQILLANLTRENQSILIDHYSRIVLWSSKRHHFILQLFSNLTHHIYFRISLAILSQIYEYVDSTSFFLPENFSVVLLNCLRVSPLNLKETNMLMSLLNRILLVSMEFKKGFQMKKEDFKQYWDYFQAVTEDRRAIFYDWITQSRKAEYEDESITTYNLFTTQLKNYIITDILCEESFSNFTHLTKKQLEIILQFFIEKNLGQLKLQEKNYYSDFKIIFRLRNIQLIKEDFLWKIFEKCKNTEVINILNKNLISFYFFYSPTVPYNLKKGRVDEFLTKLKAYLDSGYRDLNIDLIKSTLKLLKNVIELIKQDRKLEQQHTLNAANIKIQVIYEGKTFNLEVRYEDTMANIKFKIANSLKLKPISFKLLNSKQEQMGFDMKNIPVCCFPDKSFKVVEVPQEEQTLTKFVHTFLNEQIEDILFRMLESECTALQVYEVLDQLEFKQEKRLVFKKITAILQKFGQKDEANLTFIHCFYLLQIKLINRHMEDKQFLVQCISSPNFTRFLRMMTYPIKINIHITLLQSITNLFMKINKRCNLANKTEVAEKCLQLIYEVYRFAQVNRVEGQVKDYLNKINHNCILLVEDIISQHEMLVFIFSSQIIQPMLELIYFSDYYSEVKMLFNQRIQRYIGLYRLQKKKNDAIQDKMGDIYINCFYSKAIELFQSKKQRRENIGHTQLFQMLCKIIETISVQNHSAQSSSSQKIFAIYKKITAFLGRMTNEAQLRHLQSSCFLLRGHLNILKAILESRPQLKSTQIIEYILIQCLGVSNHIGKTPLCRSPGQINSAFQILKSHLDQANAPSFIKCIMDYLGPCQRIALWRANNKWSINVSPEGRQQYSGLINPGCICYMNSLLQQLFMIDQFRSGVLAIKTAPSLNQENKINGNQKKASTGHAIILPSLKNLFLNLLFSEENVINPVPFAMTIRNAQKKPMIKINQQMDIDEFQSILFDKLQKELQLVQSRNLIRQLFGGVYSNQIISTQCPHRSQREQTFISISLQVKKTIYDSFKSFVKVDVLDGDNKYFCESCNKKVKAEKIQSIKKLPPYLILSLKRFEFNFEIDSKIKINDYCEFYQKIKLKEYSTQELNRNITMTDEDIDTKQAFLPDDYYNYKLRGVVVHTGSADSGHYYSFIYNNQGNWFQFNDEEVFTFDIKKLPQQAFGSKGNYDDCRIRNAYLLIYEREVKENPVDMLPQQQIYALQQNKQLIEQILIRNQEVQKYQLVFSDNYSRLIDLMSIGFQRLDDPQAKTITSQWQEFFLSYYFLILIRKESFERFLEISEQIEKQITKNQEMCMNYLQLFTSCNFLEEFFIFNPNRERCRIISHLFYTALLKYISTNDNIEIEGNNLLNIILLNMKTLTINYGQVYQLSTALRKYLQYLAATDMNSLHFIIRNYSFQNVYLNQIFTNVLQSNQKEYYIQFLSKSKCNPLLQVPYITPIQFTDKKQNTDDYLETWRIVSLLLNESNNMIKYSETQEEDPIKKNLEYITAILSSAPINKIMNGIYQTHQQSAVEYLYRTFKVMGQLNRLREAIEKGLKDYQSSKYRPFMLLILAFLQDPAATDEIDAIIILLENAYKHNEKYFLQVDLLNQWILKFVDCSEMFLKKLQERKSLLDMILNWIARTPHPNPEQLKKHKLPSNQRLLNRYYGIVVSCDAKDYENNLILMKSCYQSILNSTMVSRGVSFIRADEPFTSDKSIKYFDPVLLKWIDSTVVDNQFGYLTIRVGHKDTNHITLWQDSQKIKISPFAENQDEVRSENSDFSYEQSDESQKQF